MGDGEIGSPRTTIINIEDDLTVIFTIEGDTTDHVVSMGQEMSPASIASLQLVCAMASPFVPSEVGDTLTARLAPSNSQQATGELHAAAGHK